METPLVSVIIPTYNRPRLLKETLDSVMLQSFQNFEIIVIDDGTPNNKNEELCTLYERITYRKIDNSGGPSRPRNAGIKIAKGKYIAFVDDDDLWLLDKLEKQVTILETNSEFGLVHTPCKVIDLEGVETGEIIGRPGTPHVKHGNVKMRMMGNWTLMMPTVLIRKTLLDQVGYFNEKMPQAGEDTEFWTRCSFYTSFYYMDEPLALYRKHRSNSEILVSNYIDLPLHLKKVVIEMHATERIDFRERKQLIRNLVYKQLKGFQSGRFKTIVRLFKLNPFWFLNFRTIKLWIKILIS
jgi:glycosyltransferase involved in cell wall biosynthesis